jgi:hypothetical protein
MVHPYLSYATKIKTSTSGNTAIDTVSVPTHINLCLLLQLILG